MINRRMTIAVFCLAGAVLLFALPAAAVDVYQGNWMVRGRALYVYPDDYSSYLTGMPGAGVTVDSEITWEVDLSYYITPHFSTELSITDTRYDLEGTGTISSLGDIADARAFSPTLSFKYHFAPSKYVTPYVGVGVNYTYFHDEEPNTPLIEAMGADMYLNMDHSWGWVGQAGVDIYFYDRWSVNFDVKYVDIDTEATFETTGVGYNRTNISVDPWITGVGVGYRF